MRHLLLAIIAVALAGCADGTPNYSMNKPGTTLQQQQADIYACSGSSTSLHLDAETGAVVMQCLRARGYTFALTNAQDVANAAALDNFNNAIAAANAAYAAGLAQSPPVQVQPMPPVPQQTFCNQLGNTVTCNGPGLQQTFCNRIGNTITCQ